MVKVVNKSGIPETIFQYLAHDEYEKNFENYSVTELLKPVREIILARRYDSVIEVDAAERLWALFGTAVHKALESGNLSELQEERIVHELNGINVSGKFDIIFNGFLHDFKVTSAFTIMFGSRDKEWSKQLSSYRWLYYKKTGTELPNKAYIIAILRDWSKWEIDPRNPRVKQNYPLSPVLEIPVNLFSLKDTELFLSKKIDEIKKYNDCPDGELPMCTDEERWYNEKQNKYQKCEKYCACKDFCLKEETNEGQIRFR